MVLYSLILGLRPGRCLEIGTFRGGSTTIMCAALDDLGGAGRLVCVDPNPQITPAVWQQLRHRTTLLTGPSPQLLPDAWRAAGGGPFDFALIDGDHLTPSVIQDTEGTMAVLANQAYMLFHDVHYDPVKNGIQQMLDKYPGTLTNCGLLSVEVTPFWNEQQYFFGGLQLLRFQRPAPQPPADQRPAARRPVHESVVKRLLKGWFRSPVSKPVS